MSDIVERLKSSLEKMASSASVDMHLWNEHSNAVLQAASRIKELEGEAEKAEMALELLRKMRHGAARARDAALADNERLREALEKVEARIRAEERERCAAVARNRGNLYEAAAERYTTPGLNQQKARTKAGVAFRLADEILNHGETDYVCVRREELEKALRSAALLVQHVDLEMPSPPPGWFADCRDDIAAIRQKLAAKD